MASLRLDALVTRHVGPVDLTVAAGECVMLSGASGSGKSLLLRAIADLDLHQGEIFLDDVGCSATKAPHWRHQVGLLPAESHWWYPQVGEHFAIGDAQWLSMVGFSEEVLDWEVARLSTGERQRLALLRLLSGRPKVLLLDELTASLDPENVQRMEELVRHYMEQYDAAVLWVSHDPEQIKRMASRHFHLQDGQLQEKK